MTKTRRRSPQVVVVESPKSTVDVGYWRARFLNAGARIYDTQTQREIRQADFFAAITGEDERGYQLAFNRSGGGRRYAFYTTYGEAQKALLAWAQRRYRLITD